MQRITAACRNTVVTIITAVASVSCFAGLASIGCGSSSTSADPEISDGASDGIVDDSLSPDDAHLDSAAFDTLGGPDALDALDALGDSRSPGVDSATLDGGARSDTLVTPSDTGLPTRLPCLGRDALATDLPLDVGGALEGELVSLVPPGTGGGCPEDTDHLHLQVAVGSKRYDVAVTIFDAPSGAPMGLIAKDVVAGSAVVAGWSSTARLDFVADLGVHSTDFAPLAKADLLTRLDSELESASSVRIFGHSYTDGTGLHNVHRNGSGHDGAIFIHRGANDHVVALRFSTDTF